MWIDDVISAQKRGQSKGITSICSAHPMVLEAAIQQAKKTGMPVVIEATCNQVNQFGGYTGMTPADFAGYLRWIAARRNFPFERIILGGDHLGPGVWQNEPAESAMQTAQALIHDYVRAGFVKIHFDCSTRLADDPPGALDVEVSASRTARLAKVAEDTLAQFGRSVSGEVHYVIGTEVPQPGGAPEYEESVNVTRVEDVRRTIQVTRQAFHHLELESAWERVVAVVVQPGVEFGDDFVLEYRPEAARDLARYIESEPALVYEAHSTDYQTRQALQSLVRDHFAILKVGPALTFAFREAVFALAMIENELWPPDERSNVIALLDEVMVRHPEHWESYYPGAPEQQALKRKFSLSDRSRYYWVQPEVRAAYESLLKNLGGKPLPLSLLSQFLPAQHARIRAGELRNDPRAMALDKITDVLADYASACG